MKIKVCGMKYPDNVKELSKLPIDYMGMIFYDKSPRFVETGQLPDTPFDKVGVFVNADIDYIKEKIKKYNLNLIQLHGNESPDFCKELNNSLSVMKVFSISVSSDLEKTDEYENICSYFLFDTKTPNYGGSGEKFDWQILNSYKGNTPFFLSGGISIDDTSAIKNITHPLFYGIDLNSRFEKEPGLKNIELIKQFIKAFRDEQD